MAVVNALRFDEYSGAIISDEESWRLRHRRTIFCDNIHCLVSPEISDALHIEAVYGGVGTPSIHYEAVTKTQEQIQNIFKQRKDPKTKTPLYQNTGDISRITMTNLQNTIRRRADDRLKFLYGFNSDDLNRGYFKTDGEKIDIKQSNVKKNALAISTLKDKSPTAQAEIDNHGCLIGYDKKHGFTAYCLKGEISVSSFVSGGFESLGTGKYGGGRSFAKFLNKKFISERTKGFDRITGMIELIYATIQGALYFSQVGGYFAIAYINGRGKTHKERYQEIFHHRAKLATEIVHAYKAGYLPRNVTYKLINDLVYEAAPENKIEEKFLRAAKNRKTLNYFLRNYKMDPLRKDK